MSDEDTLQLRLLEPVDVPLRHRLDARTRRIGLAGVARARQILDEQRRRRLGEEPEHPARPSSGPSRAA